MSKQIKLPDGWNEVTLFQYQEIAAIPDNDHRTDAVIAILADIDMEEVELMTIESRHKCLEVLQWAMSIPDDKKFKREITIDGVEFYLQDFNELLIGERIDLKNYCKDSTANMHKIMDILYKPLVQTRDTEDKILNGMTIGDCYGALVFFCLIATKSIGILQGYLIDQLTETTMKN